MYCIEVIKSQNANPPKLHTAFDRHCGFHIHKSTLILHSAVQRNTWTTSADKPDYAVLVAALKTCKTEDESDVLIEAYCGPAVSARGAVQTLKNYQRKLAKRQAKK